MDRQLRVTDDVCEQNMGDLKLDLFLNLRRHVPMCVASTPEAIIQVLPCPVEQINIDNRTLRGVARYQPAPLWYDGPNAASKAVSYAMHYSRSHDAVICVYDAAGNVIETHERQGDLREP
jgi:hypothetical protein